MIIITYIYRAATMEHTLLLTLYAVSVIILRGRSCYYLHITQEVTEANKQLRRVPKAIQLV